MEAQIQTSKLFYHHQHPPLEATNPCDCVSRSGHSKIGQLKGAGLRSVMLLPVVNFMHKTESHVVIRVERVLDDEQGKGYHG
jgi:hypothetical protein